MARAPKTPAPQGRTAEQIAASRIIKNQKFRELAQRRMSVALKRIHMLDTLANKQNYNFTEDEAQRIVGRLRDAVSEVERMFEVALQARRGREHSFSFDEPRKDQDED